MAAYSLDDNPKAVMRIGIETYLLAMDLLFVTLRLWARAITRTRLGFNDYTILVAMVSVCVRHLGLPCSDLCSATHVRQLCCDATWYAPNASHLFDT